MNFFVSSKDEFRQDQRRQPSEEDPIDFLNYFSMKSNQSCWQEKNRDFCWLKKNWKFCAPNPFSAMIRKKFRKFVSWWKKMAPLDTRYETDFLQMSSIHQIWHWLESSVCVCFGGLNCEGWMRAATAANQWIDSSASFLVFRSKSWRWTLKLGTKKAAKQIGKIQCLFPFSICVFQLKMNQNLFSPLPSFARFFTVSNLFFSPNSNVAPMIHCQVRGILIFKFPAALVDHQMTPAGGKIERNAQKNGFFPIFFLIRRHKTTTDDSILLNTKF